VFLEPWWFLAPARIFKASVLLEPDGSEQFLIDFYDHPEIRKRNKKIVKLTVNK
jgi:hypothetical protein